MPNITGGEITRHHTKLKGARLLAHTREQLRMVLDHTNLEDARARIAELHALLGQQKVIGDTITTADTNDRRGADDYQTDPRLAAAFFASMKLPRPQHTLDLGAGVGVFGRALDAYYNDPGIIQHGIDIQKNLMPGTIYQRRILGSFVDPSVLPPLAPALGGPGYDLIGWNFPYGNEEHRDLITQFLYRAWEMLPLHEYGEIWTLTRLNWLAGAQRANTLFTTNNPTGVAWKEDILVLSTRPTFYWPIPDADNFTGGTLDDTYGGKTYPTDYVMVRFAFRGRQPVGQGSILGRLTYDKRRPRRAKEAPRSLSEEIFS
jgi:hypothetical protein